MRAETRTRLEFERMVPAHLFEVFPEVRGELGESKPIKRKFKDWGLSNQKVVRIDYVLCPRKPLLEAGWELGSIGVEIKNCPGLGRSGSKFGRVLSQLFDYQ